jgi:hypothetical protein
MTATIRQCKKLCPALLGLLFAFLCLLPPGARAQTAYDTELQVKAGFIYNFALFVQWPAQAFTDTASPLELCIAGDRAAVKPFEPIATKKILDRTVTVHAFDDNSTRHPCHIIYIDTKTKAEAADLLRRVSGPGVLTIGDQDGFCRLGGIINFYTENNKLRFEINTDAAGRAGLKLSSQLLKLAKIFREEKP